jgi:hypothetical protein
LVSGGANKEVSITTLLNLKDYRLAIP